MITAVAVGVPVASAGACSCAGGDPRVRLSNADAAFVGTVTSKRRVPGVTLPGAIEYVFSVEQTYKGSLPATLSVRTSDNEGTCGLNLRDGERIGLLLREDDSAWTAGLCDVIEPAELEEAIQPHPRGSGSGRARLLVSGPFHDAGLAVLGNRGRLIGWVFGSEGDEASVCPGSRYAVQAGDGLAVIRLRDLRVVHRRPLPGDWTHAVRCLDRRARDVVAVTVRFGEAFARQTLVRISDDRARRVGTQNAVRALLGERTAYFSLARRRGKTPLVAIRYRDGRHRRIGEPSRSSELVALSPDERRIATIENYRHPRLRLIDVATGRTRSRDIDAEWAQPVWLDPGRIAVTRRRGRAMVLDLRLRRVAALPGWNTPLTAVAGERLWWVTRKGGIESLDTRSGTRAAMEGPRLAGARGIEAMSRPARIIDAHRRTPGVTGTATRCDESATGA